MKWPARLKLPKFPTRISTGPIKLKQLHKKFFGKKTDKKNRFKLSWKTVGKYSLYLLGVFVLVIVFLFAWYSKDLPTPGKIRNLTSEASTRLFDRSGKSLYTISGEKRRIIIESKDIPEIVKQATIAIEDKRFYSHPGLDVRGLARAFLYGGSRGGGSTITQQFVKNALLTNERTFDRKIKEAILSVQLEFLYTKDEILTMYLNEIPYGGNNYGVESAAKAFFGKTAKELTIAEAATLAALPQSPSTLSPYGQYTDRLIARRNLTIDLMLEEGYINAQQAEEAKATQLSVKPRSESIAAPHFVLYVKEWLTNYFTEELGDAQLAEQKVEAGGLVVTTTLDLDKQNMAQEVVSSQVDALKRYKASNAGAVVIDPTTGEIIVMVGSVDYFQEQFGAYNVTVAKRQPGSSFKPIVYAASFKENYNPSSILFDVRTDFGNYEPDNYDGRFRGPISIRDALGQSLNIPAVKILDLIGLDKAMRTAADLGITTLTDKDRYGLSLVLGGGEVMPLEMATAYGVFANNGLLVPTNPILKVTDSNGKVLIDRTQNKDSRQVIDPQVAFLITDVLADVNAKRPVFGGFMSYLTLRNQVAATKTGTTNLYKDAWTVGYTPYYSAAVWAGNNDNSSMNAAGGSIAAAPIWDRIMENLHADLPAKNFTRPDGIVEVEVDKLSNKLPVEGSNKIKDLFARWSVPRERDDVNQRVRVCRENGLLADSSIPDEVTEIRVFKYVRSEKPNNPKWESPVRAWAEANGYNQKPPTEKCSLNSSAVPQITLTSPTNNQTITGSSFEITANASAPSGVESVSFAVDGIVIATDSSAPYSTSYNTASLSNGAHSVSATVRSVSGATATTSVSINIAKDTTAPPNVTNFNGTPGIGSVSLNWTNPALGSFTKIKIYVYQGESSTVFKTFEVNNPLNTLTITSLTSSQAYRFTAKTVGSNSVESSGTTIYVTPL